MSVMSAHFKTFTVLDHSNAKMVHLNPIQGMDVRVVVNVALPCVN